MTEPSLPELEAFGTGCTCSWRRRRFPAGLGERELPQVRQGELRVRGPGSSRPRAAVPVDRTKGRRKRIGRQLAAAEIEKVRREIVRHAEFTAAVEQIVEVNERICETRPVAGGRRPQCRRAKRGSSPRSRKRSPPR